jgi:hypothetical protein
MAVSWLRLLIAGFSPQRHGFHLGSVHVRFVVDKVALGHILPSALRSSPASIIPQLLHNHYLHVAPTGRTK